MNLLAVSCLLVAGSHRHLIHAWRSECDLGDFEVEVSFHGLGERSETNARKCRAVYLSDADLREFSGDVSGADLIFTDSLAHVPFRGRRGHVHFIENISEFEVPDDLDGIMHLKTELLSVLMPPKEAWGDLAATVFEQARALLPDHIYTEDGSLETHAAAFSRYRFSLIVEDLQKRTISLALVRSIAHHTIGVFNGFVELGAMFFNGVADFEASNFNLVETMDTLKKHNEHLGSLWHYQRIIQDQLQYRYNRPFEERLFSQACSVCRLHMDPEHVPPMVFVGIYSARANFEKRKAVRETWGRVLKEVYGFKYKFFLGAASEGAALDDVRIRFELDTHDDLIFLDASEGYRMNSQKGLLFLEWIALRVEAEFLLKVDDDVYLRPAPLIEQLRERPPTSYIWGYFDYISPVPREEEDNFYNAPEVFPFDVFPPYPRGVVRVLSMDVVRLLSKASRQGRLSMIYGDDPCIGVHLRQLLFDPQEPLPSITLDDFDNRVFAMEPSCHPNLWSRITNKTWAIHHVSPDQIRCMWTSDVEAGYYQDSTQKVTLGLSTPLDMLPDLCSCASDPAFAERTDLDNLRRETELILNDDAEQPTQTP